MQQIKQHLGVNCQAWFQVGCWGELPGMVSSWHQLTVAQTCKQVDAIQWAGQYTDLEEIQLADELMFTHRLSRSS